MREHADLADPAALPFVREILWREFAYHLLYHFPQTPDSPLDPRSSRFPWRETGRAPLLRAWQWTAGCGADAAPYLRVFNPVRQGERFDPDGAYVRRWCPELARLPDRFVHCPWTAPEAVLRQAGIELGRDYPRPIVDLASSRLEALAAFETLKAGAADPRDASCPQGLDPWERRPRRDAAAVASPPRAVPPDPLRRASDRPAEPRHSSPPGP